MLENRPIISCVIGYITGIILGLYCKISIVFLYLILLIIYLITYKQSKKEFKLISFKRYKRYIKIVFTKKVIKIIIISSIISNSIVLYQNYNYDNLYKNLENQELKIYAIVQSNVREKNNKQIYKIKIETINKNNKYKNSFLYLNVKKKLNIELNYGDIVELNGVYKAPKTIRNYKGFDYKEYLKTLKIYGAINSDKIKLLGSSKTTIFSLSNKITLRIKKEIQESFDKDTGHLLVGLILGDTSSIDEDIKQSFNNSNISHILAISGMHVGYILFFTALILDRVLGKRKSKIGTSIILLIYMFITGFSPSVVRAGIMAIITIMASFFYRKSDTWSNISLSLLIILINNACLRERVSVLLSFAGTIGIIVLQKNIKSITISATIFIMPIMAICFNKIAISSLIISLIVGFLIGPIIILGFIFIIGFKLLILFKLKVIYVKILNFALEALINIAKLGSILPFNKIYVTTPTILEILIYYVFILIRCFFI